MLYPSLFISKRSPAQCSVETGDCRKCNLTCVWLGVTPGTRVASNNPLPVRLQQSWNRKYFKLSSLHWKYLYLLRKTPLHYTWQTFQKSGFMSDILTSWKTETGDRMRCLTSVQFQMTCPENCLSQIKEEQKIFCNIYFHTLLVDTG